MKNNNKWTVRDVITTVLLTVALILIQLTDNVNTEKKIRSAAPANA